MKRLSRCQFPLLLGRGVNTWEAFTRLDEAEGSSRYLQVGQPHIYDEYVSGYRDCSAIGKAEIGAMLSALGNALSYIIVVDGQIVGTWKRTLRKDAVVIKTNLFTRLTQSENRAVAVAAQRYGEFLKLPVRLA